MKPQPAAQIPGVYHRRIGDMVVTTISDGYLDGTFDVMRNVDIERARQILTDSFRPARRTSVNTFLIHSKGRIAIVDTGSGNYLQPTAGFVQRNLAMAGIDPKSIDTVLLTHMHPDHSAGLTDMSNGQLLFPNAELVMHENELAHWFDDGAMAKVDERSAQLYFQAGREQVLQEQDAIVQGGRGVSRRHCRAEPWAYAGPHRVSDRLRQRSADDLGRHGARTGSANRVSRS